MPTISYIEKIIDGRFLGRHSNPLINHLLIDSRNVSFPEDSVFFAIKGNTHNGNDYIDELYKKGVRCFIVTEPPKSTAPYQDANFVLVPDAVEALQKLVAHHRKQFSVPVIGVTGSNGKTIVKEWLYQLLWHDHHIVRSPKSYNSQVGVPLSVWQMDKSHQMGIFEAGISQPEEMANIEPIIHPSIGIFTNIGPAHDEGFDDINQKIEEKLRLFKHAETLIYCKDYPELHAYIYALQNTEKTLFSRTIYNYETLTWSRKQKADLQITSIHKEETFTIIKAVFKKELISIQIPFSDEASIENAIHCWLLMLHLKYDFATIATRMKHLSRVAMRLELKAGINNCTIINDAYNSDINSLAIALDFLEHQNQHEQKTIILSDILESGEDAEILCQKMAELIRSKKINRLLGVGIELFNCKALFEGTPAQFFLTTQNLLDADIAFGNETILVKGARHFEFERIVKSLSQKTHSTVLEIELTAIGHNLRTYRKLLKADTKIMIMVKALSYGSGSFEIANVLQFNKVDYLAVAYEDEGIALRNAGITLPIMVMNPNPKSFDLMVQHRLEPEIYSLSHLNRFLEFLQTAVTNITLPYPVHLKMDTGMHRLGFEKEDLPQLIKRLINSPYIKVVSAFSHLAASEDEQHDDFSYEQIVLFKELHTKLVDGLGYPIMHHILNSAGIIRFAHELETDMVRLGLGLYGIDSTGVLDTHLQNVSTLKTYISQIKTIKAGETIGYGRLGKAKRKTTIATVGIGYGDGLSRQLGNGKGKMLVKGKAAPIIGNVCMDMCMLDVSKIKNVNEGDEVIVFGKAHPINQLAKWQNTIPYEIMTGISGRVKRVYYQE